jgi:DmsE family decaheme c-type cytochrome
MPVREGKLTCSSCHNVHGAANVKLLKTGSTVTEACYSCHAEKRGPMLWEHAPVTENCTTCHDPHGSSNERMLVAKQPFLCQRCHVTSRHPPTVYEGYLLNNSTNGNKIYGRSCMVCHQQVHGSNAPSGKAFLR